MYNNEITYDEKWNTPENRKALEKLQRKYFNYSACRPDCPVAWAPEVLELFELLDKELGFIRNEGTIRGYYVQGNFFNWFLKDPIKNFFSSFKTYIISCPTKWDRKAEVRIPLSWSERFDRFVSSTLHPIKYGFRATKVAYINKYLNKYSKAKISLGQVKEKYGSLRVYFSAPAAFEEWVENEIRKCEIKLAMKGAYYPVESFWDSGIGYSAGTEYNPDIIKSEMKTDPDGRVWYSVDKTTYRGVMKELGLDLKEIEKKAILRKASKADPL